MTLPQESPSANGPILAAQYVRMSTEHQQYSIDNQSDAISAYAKTHNMEIVRTYADAGKSGLTIENRPGLRQMIADAEAGSPGFSAILVYDVSRWGRFQDADESAFYEYRCRRASIAVHYCAEPFSNDGSTIAALIKTIKRTMAAEYSRELSAKVSAGRVKLIELGFRQGGRAGFGLRRLLVDKEGKPKFILNFGDRKNIATDRIVLTPGPKEEVAVVRQVFRLYASERWSPAKIARLLNARGLKGEDGKLWTRDRIRDMVTNPKYIGANIGSRYSEKLRTRRVVNPPDKWIRRDNAFPAIVDPKLFQRSVSVSVARRNRLTDQELLDGLRKFLRENGRLTARLITAAWDMPCAQVYDSRFGGLSEAYKLIGYKPGRNLDYVAREKELLPVRRAFTAQVVSEFQRLGASAMEHWQSKLVIVNNHLRFRISVARCLSRKTTLSWKLFLKYPEKIDGNVVARLAPGNKEILDYFHIPWKAKSPGQITVTEKRFGELESRRYMDLAFLADILATI
jgi:DNA invertase Pin-like site-specific DNA recombinase